MLVKVMVAAVAAEVVNVLAGRVVSIVNEGSSENEVALA